MKKLSKSILALVLCMIFVFSMAPIRAKAGENKETATSMNFGQWANINWTSSNCNTTFWAKVSVTERGFLNIWMNKPKDNTGDYKGMYIAVLNSAGTLVWDTDCSGQRYNTSTMYDYFVGVDNGVYYIQITPLFTVTSGTFNSNFTMYLYKNQGAEFEPNNTLANATYMEINECYTGYAGFESQFKDDDFYTAFLQEGKTYELEIGSYDYFDGDFFMVYPDGARLFFSKTNCQKVLDGKVYFVFECGQSGQYYFGVVGNRSDYHEYTLQLIGNKNGWEKIDEGWNYYFDGVRVTGTWRIDGKPYYFYPDGLLMQDKGWVNLESRWVYNNEDGSLTTDWKKINGSWFYFDNWGSMKTNWCIIGDTWYYLGTDGVMRTNWQKVNGSWFYLGSDGAMRTGWKQVGGTWYYFGSDGVMRTNWQKIDGTWYYFGTDGAMSTNWRKVDGAWYYFGSNGAMRSGWSKIDGSWYYFGNAMKTNWQKIDGIWYYFGSDGAMRTGWQKIDGTWYYFKASGAMTSGEILAIDGVLYEFRTDGSWIH